VLMQHRATSLVRQDGRIVAVEASTPDGMRRFDAEHVISTMPIRSLVQALEPAAEPDVQRAGDALNYRDFLVVALILDQEDLFPDNWIYVHSPDVRVGRIQNFNNWSRAMVPEAGRTCLGLEYFCFEGDGLWASRDEDLVALAGREIGVLGLADASMIKDAAVVRMPKAYPVYDAGYADHLSVVRQYLDTIPNLQLVGRNGMHKYNNQDHSMLTAMMAVWNLQGASHDLWSVNSDFDYHEEIQQHERSAPAGIGT
jgi:protoporphyrinogen oxidase